MTRDDIIRMAKQAHAHHLNWDPDYVEGLERFAELVAAAEREACVLIVTCEAQAYSEPVWAVEIVNDIRARGEK